MEQCEGALLHYTKKYTTRHTMVTYGHYVKTSGSLSKHDHGGNKNVTNLHIWQWKTVVLHALHVQFSFLYISMLFSSFQRRETTCFAVVWKTWAYGENFQYFVSFFISQRLIPIDSQIFRIHFASIMTWNNWEIIAETRSYIFRWFSRCRRRRVCLSSLTPTRRSQ